MSTNSTSLTGINLAGAEFGSEIPGTKRSTYRYPNADQYACSAQSGFNIVRLPFKWERLEPTLGANLDKAHLAEIDNAVGQAKLHSMSIILDMHNSAKYNGANITKNPALQSSYYDFWGHMAQRFRSSDNVMFGVMNKPVGVDAAQWVQITQHAIDAIRSNGFTGPLLLSGVRVEAL
jgi:endoglucanase